MGRYLELGPEAGSISHYITPSPVMCHSYHTSKMTGTHQEQQLNHLRVLLFFIELNILLYMIISRHKRQQNPAPAQLRKSITNFRKPLEVGLKLAVTLRHLSRGETYTSLQYHWRVGRTTIQVVLREKT